MELIQQFLIGGAIVGGIAMAMWAVRGSWRGILPALVAAAVLWPDLSVAQTPTPTPTVRIGSYTWVQYVSSEGKDRVPSFGARLQVSARVSRMLIAARLDASAQKEGVDIENAGTYSTVEGFVLGAVRVTGPFSAAGVWGTTRPSPGETGTERQTWAGGVLVGDGSGEAWIFAAVGKHDAAGEGLRPILALQAPLRDRTSIVGDAVLGRNWQVRAGIAVRLR